MRSALIIRAAALGAAAIAFSAPPGVAQAASGTVPIAHTSMHIDGRSDTPFFVSISGGFLKTDAGGSTARCFTTGVDLPIGARLKKLRVWSSGVTNGGVLFNLSALNLSTGRVATVFNGTRGDESGERVQSIVTLPATATVSTTTAYGFSICLDPGESFSGARVDYVTD